MLEGKTLIAIVTSIYQDANVDNINTIMLVRFLIKAEIVDVRTGGEYLWRMWEPI